jgi:hypothetical protein
LLGCGGEHADITQDDPIVEGGLAGTWDLTGAASNGTPVTGTLSIAPDTFDLEIEDTALTMRVSGAQIALTWRDGDRTTNISTARSTSPMDEGGIPFDVGGNWTFRGSDDPHSPSCTAKVASDTFSAACEGISGQPRALPSLNGSMTATRQAPLESSFGALGGNWRIEAGGTSVVVRLEQQSLDVQVLNGDYEGRLTLATTGRIATGATSGGLEFSARKR